MFLTKRQTVDDIIVHHLTLNPGARFSDIISEGNRKLVKPVTERAWYKALRRLIDDGVVVKAEKSFVLNNSWLQQAADWLERAKVYYVDQLDSYVLKLPDARTRRVIYRFHTLTSLNTFWAHVLVSLAIRNPKSKLYCYNPHHWFFLVQNYEEQQFQQSLKRNQITQYLIIGSRSPLDQWGEKFFDRKVVRHYYSPRPLFNNRAMYYNAVGEYVLEVKISRKTREVIESVFLASDLSEERMIKIRQTLMKNLTSTLIVMWDPVRAKKLARKIGKYF